jgi:DNA-binding MarR family transcriptional regulator
VRGDNKGHQKIASLTELDRVIHEPARLTILVHLYVAEKADFLYLMRQTGLTGGNLSSHISKLESFGYVAVDKSFEGKIPRTTVGLTEQGRRAFET